MVTTDYGFDAFGNLNSVTVTPVGQPARLTLTDWGGTGRFPLTITNPLNQNTTLAWEADQGVLDTVTDANGLVINYDYDGFGRMTRQLRPDGTATRWTIGACSSPSYCGDSRLRSYVLESRRDNLDAVIHSRYVYRDMFDRAKYHESVALKGGLATTQIDYDAVGRVASRSVPFYMGSADPYKVVTFHYDLLNRIWKVERQVSEEDTSLQSTQRSFNGLSLTETNALGQSTTQKFNAVGQVIQVIDATGSDTDYEYDAFGSLVKTRDVMGNEISFGYNVRGFKTASTDPDMGTWTHDYFPTGELKSQTNARNQTVNFTYDKLSRPLTRIEPEGTTTWTWGTSAASRNIGKLAQVASPGSYSEAFTYDTFARLSQTSVVADGATYSINQSYNAAGLQETLTYPTSTSGVRIKVKYSYENGHLVRINDFTNDVVGTKYWEAIATNARGLVIDEELGNNLRTLSEYEHIAGWLDTRKTGPGGGSTTLNLNYDWDKLGNLTKREDLNLGLSETFSYDGLNRLDTTVGPSSVNTDYDAIGRITFKSDVGSYSYHATKKHAATAAGSNTYAYDANGNMSTRNGKAITWTSYDLPSQVQPTTDTNYNQFFYNAWRQRYKQVYKAGTTVETTIYVGGILEKWVSGSTTQWRHLIQANGRTVALLSRTGTTNTVRYPLSDQIGGISILTNSSGGIYVKESFDAFGKRRNPSTWSGPPSSGDMTLIRNATRRGYTLHEGLDNTNLIHMNGRIYDPSIGRFLSADPYIQAPFDSQSLNPYSYVFNNPLSWTDPSGFCGATAVNIASGGVAGPSRRIDDIEDLIDHSLSEDLHQIPSLMSPCPASEFAAWQQGLSGGPRGGGGGGATGNPSLPGVFGNASSPATCDFGPCSNDTRTIVIVDSIAVEVWWEPFFDRRGQTHWRARAKAACGPEVPVETHAASCDAIYAVAPEAWMFVPMRVARAVAPARAAAIGATGSVGEKALAALGGVAHKFFPTSQGARFVDRFVNGVAHESKTGYATLTKDIATQIAKDVELRATGQITDAVWHFYRSPVTGMVGPSGPLAAALQKAGIKIVIVIKP
jgi:RHS repeat-associated protein